MNGILNISMCADFMKNDIMILMFNFKKKQVVSYKDIIKKINYQLTNNFFSIEEFVELSNRQAYKIIKLIAKLNNIKLRKNEIKNLVMDIKSIDENLNNINVSKVQNFSKLFNWSIKFIAKKVEYVSSFVIKIISYIFIFRLNRKKIIRI